MNDDTFDRQALNDALRRGDIRALDNLGFIATFDDVEQAMRQYAHAIGRGVETLTQLEMQQAMLNWVLNGRPQDDPPTPDK
jgi:hypothetical protein